MAHNEHNIGAVRIMRAADWRNIADCALGRKDECGNPLRWKSVDHYHRYQREYQTMIFMWARAARADR